MPIALTVTVDSIHLLNDEDTSSKTGNLYIVKQHTMIVYQLPVSIAGFQRYTALHYMYPICQMSLRTVLSYLAIKTIQSSRCTVPSTWRFTVTLYSKKTLLVPTYCPFLVCSVVRLVNSFYVRWRKKKMGWWSFIGTTDRSPGQEQQQRTTITATNTYVWTSVILSFCSCIWDCSVKIKL